MSKKTQTPDTVEGRAILIEDMQAMSELDVREFAFIQPFSTEDKTQYRTNRTMIKNPVKQKRLGISFQAVELHIDFCRAFESGNFKEATILYFQLLSITRR